MQGGASQAAGETPGGTSQAAGETPGGTSSIKIRAVAETVDVVHEDEHLPATPTVAFGQIIENLLLKRRFARCGGEIQWPSAQEDEPQPFARRTRTWHKIQSTLETAEIRFRRENLLQLRIENP